MENKLDLLVEEIEVLSNVITKLNFDMEGLKEDISLVRSLRELKWLLLLSGLRLVQYSRFNTETRPK